MLPLLLATAGCKTPSRRQKAKAKGKEKVRPFCLPCVMRSALACCWLLPPPPPIGGATTHGWATSGHSPCLCFWRMLAKAKGKEKVRPFCLPCFCVGRLLPLQAKKKCAPFAFALLQPKAKEGISCVAFCLCVFCLCVATAKSKGRHKLRCLLPLRLLPLLA
jgi:hypothetical protein